MSTLIINKIPLIITVSNTYQPKKRLHGLLAEVVGLVGAEWAEVDAEAARAHCREHDAGQEEATPRILVWMGNQDKLKEISR